MSFYVGQKVICVDDQFSQLWVDDELTGNRPVKGVIYTIRGIVTWNFRDGTGPAIYLEEVVNSPNPRGWFGNLGHLEHPFTIERFRPVIERKTDISIFTEMLTPKKISEPVR